VLPAVVDVDLPHGEHAVGGDRQGGVAVPALAAALGLVVAALPAVEVGVRGRAGFGAAAGDAADAGGGIAVAADLGAIAARRHGGAVGAGEAAVGVARQRALLRQVAQLGAAALVVGIGVEAHRVAHAVAAAGLGGETALAQAAAGHVAAHAVAGG